MGRVRAVTGWERQHEIAAFLGIKASSVSGCKARDSFPVEWAFKIASAYNVSTDWLLTGEGEKDRGSTAIKGEIRRIEKAAFAEIPMASDELSAGGGQVVLSDTLRETYSFRRDWLAKKGIAKNKAVLMRVRGDSMSPTLEEGDTVLVDLLRTRVQPGRIYAIGMEDLIAVKRLEFRGAVVRIISDNRELYEAYDVATDGIRVIGQVVWFARELGQMEGE